MPVRLAPPVVFAAALALVALGGCDDPKKAQNRGILDRKTQDIRDAPTETSQGGGVEVKPHIGETDPISQTFAAREFAMETTSQMKIDYAVKLYQADHDAWPKDTAEFMDVIVKANGITLPELPFYRKYAYKPDEHRLVIIEYPELKKKGGGGGTTPP